MKEWSGRRGGTVDVHVHACTELAYARSDSRSRPVGVQPIIQVRQAIHCPMPRSYVVWTRGLIQCYLLRMPGFGLAYLASQDPRLIIRK